MEEPKIKDKFTLEQAREELVEALVDCDSILDGLSRVDFMVIDGDKSWDRAHLDAWKAAEKARDEIEWLLEMMGGEKE